MYAQRAELELQHEKRALCQSVCQSLFQTDYLPMGVALIVYYDAKQRKCLLIFRNTLQFLYIREKPWEKNTQMWRIYNP